MAKHVYCVRLNPDSPTEIEDLGTVEEMAMSHYPTLPLDQAKSNLVRLVQGWSVEQTWYEIAEPCSTCHQRPGESRVDNGLAAGIHCDSCWDDLVATARQRSW